MRIHLDTVFDCDRTCPAHETPDSAGRFPCRFNAILRGLTGTAHSHTVKIKTELRDAEVLRRAVKALGGTFLGTGTHKLYQGTEHGHGFRLPNWQYPLCACDNGQLAYDDFSGAWGNVADLERLKAEYAVSMIERNAATLGWLTERTAQGVVVHCPDGGTLTYANGICETTGFLGTGCHLAREQLGLKPDGEAINKIEHDQMQAAIQLPG